MPAMAWLRDIAYGVGALATSPVWGWRLWRTGKWRTDWRGRFGHAACAPDDPRTLLIHAVSVGEVNAARGLVAELQRRHGDDLRIVISVTTNTGTARARSLYKPRHTVVRYPLDFTCCVRRFLDTVRPTAVALVELEVWPNFLDECDRRGIGVAVINGRLSERSYRRYRLIRPLVAGTFGKLAAAAVQDDACAERFAGLGVPRERIEITGTMKWDNAKIADDVDGSAALAAAMGIDRDRPLVVAGSTGPGEEAMLVEELDGLTDGEGRAAQLMCVPRKPERFDEAAVAMGEPVRRSKYPDGERREHSEAGRFLLDTMGELNKAYALADVVVVGRSFSPQWGSDMMEPIALGKPTVIGPNTADFADVMTKLLAGGGIVQLSGRAEVRAAVAGLLGTERGRALAERGRAVIREQQGATQRYAALVERLAGAGNDDAHDGGIPAGDCVDAPRNP